ncbi:unnamed protein product [Schistosoma margrebowiei]|uniref:Methyltransferase type 11 domain-containing protein n=1 Tax=Schistosoma margrebowiei TaxID=48269 RepID=A0AA85ALS9_9TREM|nr:unnamed protein product [Schistosoma margrebowiei]
MQYPLLRQLWLVTYSPILKSKFYIHSYRKQQYSTSPIYIYPLTKSIPLCLPKIFDQQFITNYCHIYNLPCYYNHDQIISKLRRVQSTRRAELLHNQLYNNSTDHTDHNHDYHDDRIKSLSTSQSLFHQHQSRQYIQIALYNYVLNNLLGLSNLQSTLNIHNHNNHTIPFLLDLGCGINHLDIINHYLLTISNFNQKFIPLCIDLFNNNNNTNTRPPPNTTTTTTTRNTNTATTTTTTNNNNSNNTATNTPPPPNATTTTPNTNTATTSTTNTTTTNNSNNTTTNTLPPNTTTTSTRNTNTATTSTTTNSNNGNDIFNYNIHLIKCNLMKDDIITTRSQLLPFKDYSIDYIISISFLQWLLRKDKSWYMIKQLMNEIKRLLNPSNNSQCILQFYPSQLIDIQLISEMIETIQSNFNGCLLIHQPIMNRGMKIFIYLTYK